MDVRLDDDTMKGIIAKSIVDTLTPEARENLIATAVKGLLARPSGSNYDAKTPLQSAFDSAIREVANQIARESIIGNAEISAKIKQMIADSWEKLVNDENYSKIVEKVTSAIERGLTGDRY